MIGVDVDGRAAMADLGGRGQTVGRPHVHGGADRTVETATPRRRGGRT